MSIANPQDAHKRKVSARKSLPDSMCRVLERAARVDATERVINKILARRDLSPDQKIKLIDAQLAKVAEDVA